MISFEPIVEVRRAQVTMQRTPGRLSVDSSQGRREAGYLTLLELSSQIAAEGVQGALAGAARTAAEGDQMAHIERGGNVIAQIAQQRVLSRSQDLSFNLNLLPQTPPAVEYQPGTLSIDFVY